MVAFFNKLGKSGMILEEGIYGNNQALTAP
jgi:hypothetical protein